MMFNVETADKYYRLGGCAALKWLEPQVGGLTQTSKMPWLSYSLSAEACQTGSKLREIVGSVCSKCYAHKGFYKMTPCKLAQETRLDAIESDINRWAGYMAAVIERKAGNITPGKRFFRWHDSGDIQSDDHFNAMCWIASKVPTVMFWLPTKERPYASWPTPYNLTVRYSMPMIWQKRDSGGLLYATVGVFDEGFQCQVTAGKCGKCRACWNGRIKVINYYLN